jgi:HNH endonuclease/Methylase-associated X1
VARTRISLVRALCGLVGQSVCRVIAPRDGWPSVIEVQLSGGPQRFSAHIGRIHSHSRRDYEYRFQNPAEDDRPPVTVLPGTIPLLLGVWNGDGPPVIVAAEPEIRLGDTTRFSVLFPQRLFREAQEFGWAEPYRNSRGNLHWSFLPPLLPAFIELYQARIPIDPMTMQIAALSSGLVDEPSDAASARARQSVTRLVRTARFGQKVVAAYGGICAMCGINLGLVSGAHILPVSAVSSVDEIWNALALCENHHRAFDSHRLWVEPSDRRLRIHPSILDHARSNERSQLFVDTTLGTLLDPLRAADLPNPDMFRERYQYFKDDYNWV